MALKKREKVLVGVTGSLIVVLAGMYLFTGRGSKLSELRTQRDDLKKEVDELTIKARPGRRASKRLGQWRKRSLPSKADVASAEYSQWLSKLAVDRVGLQNASIKPYTIQPHRGFYTSLPFKIEGRGSLDRLTRFLFEFESAGYLHKVRSLTSTPIEGSKELKLVINVEGLSLPGAEHQDGLPTGQPSRLEHSELKEYLNAIVRRRMEGERFVDSGGLFASYVPQRTVASPKISQGPPPRVDPPRFDPSAHTYVSGIHDVDGVPEVWLRVRTEDKTLYLHEGDPFEVGTIRGKIARIRIDEREVEIEVDGQRWLVALNKNLQQRVALPGQSPTGEPAGTPGSDLQGAVFMRPPQ